MIHRKIILMLFFTTMIIPGLGAQCLTCLVGKSLLELRQGDDLDVALLTGGLPEIMAPLTFPRPVKEQTVPAWIRPIQQPQAYAVHNLAFFCRLEVKLEKAAKLPVKFRLGEVQEVERLEGKYGELFRDLRH